MARRRYISTDISTDRRISQLSPPAALLYTWMIPHAEDDGGITGDVDELRLKVVPGMKLKVAECVDAMLALGLLEREGDRLFFPAPSFYKYQSYVKPENRRKTPENIEERRKSAENAASVPISDPVPVPISPPVPVSSEGGSDPEHPSDFQNGGMNEHTRPDSNGTAASGDPDGLADHLQRVDERQPSVVGLRRYRSLTG